MLSATFITVSTTFIQIKMHKRAIYGMHINIVNYKCILSKSIFNDVHDKDECTYLSKQSKPFKRFFCFRNRLARERIGFAPFFS